MTYLEVLKRQVKIALPAYVAHTLLQLTESILLVWLRPED